MQLHTLYTLLGQAFATKLFDSSNRKAIQRWRERQELKYGACLRMEVE